MAGEARYSVGIDLGTTNSAMACADLTSDDATAIEVLAIPQLVNAGEVSDAFAAAVLPVRRRRVRFSGRQPPPPLAGRRRCAVGRRRTGAEARIREPVAPRGVGQVVAVVRRREPHVADSAVGRAGGGAEALAGRRVGALPAAPPAGVGRALRCGTAGTRARPAGRADHRARVVRRGGARADASRRGRSAASRA